MHAVSNITINIKRNYDALFQLRACWQYQYYFSCFPTFSTGGGSAAARRVETKMATKSNKMAPPPESLLKEKLIEKN